MIYSGTSSLSAHCALFIIDLRGSLIKFRNMLRCIGNLHSPWPTHRQADLNITTACACADKLSCGSSVESRLCQLIHCIICQGISSMSSSCVCPLARPLFALCLLLPWLLGVRRTMAAGHRDTGHRELFQQFPARNIFPSCLDSCLFLVLWRCNVWAPFSCK